MKVLQIITSLRTGGAEKLILDSVPVYQQKGIDTDVLILLNQDTGFKKELEKHTQGKVYSLTKGSVYNPLLIFKLIPYLRQYDIIHAHLFPTLYWVVLAKCFLPFSKTKIFYTEHSTNNRRRSHFILSKIDKLIYSKLSFVGCISQGVFDNLKTYLRNFSQVKVIYNGINLSAFKKKNISLKNHFFSDTDKIIIQVSSFRKQKDQETLINALKLLPSEFKLLLVGDGLLRKEREKQVQDLELQHRVHFLGIRDDIPQLLSSSDIVVLSSHYEGFGLAIVEGMAANKPVIASDVSGIREIVENFGLLFEQGNDQDLADKIMSLYKDEDYYQKVKERCFLRANDFDINNMVDLYIDEYKKAIK